MSASKHSVVSSNTHRPHSRGCGGRPAGDASPTDREPDPDSEVPETRRQDGPVGRAVEAREQRLPGDSPGSAAGTQPLGCCR